MKENWPTMLVNNDRGSLRIRWNISVCNVNVNISIFPSVFADSYRQRERVEKRGSHARHIGIHAACVLRPYSAILHIEHLAAIRLRVYVRELRNMERQGVKKRSSVDREEDERTEQYSGRRKSSK